MLVQADEAVLKNLIEEAVARSVAVALRQATEKDLLTTAEVANLFSLSKRTLMGYRKRKLMPYHRIGGRILYQRADVVSFLAHRRVHSRREGSV